MWKTQKLHSTQHGTVWLWWRRATGLCPHDWLEEAPPGVLIPGALQRREAAMQDGGHRECLVPLSGVGAAGSLTCRSCAVAEALSDQVQKLWEAMSSLNNIGKDKEEKTESSQWHLQSYTVQGRGGKDSLVMDGNSRVAENLWLLASGRRVLLCPQIWSSESV